MKVGSGNQGHGQYCRRLSSDLFLVVIFAIVSISYLLHQFTAQGRLVAAVADGSDASIVRWSICEGGKVRMVLERIKMSRGGESLEEVVGRREEEELSEFEAWCLNLSFWRCAANSVCCQPGEMFC